MPSEERVMRAREVLAKALCLLDSFAGDGLCHIYGNGQTIDAADICSELAEVFDLPCEPGWWRKLPELLAFADEGSGIGDGRGPLSRAEKDAVLSYMERHCPHRAKETAWDAVSAFNAILRRRLIAIELTQE